MAATLSGWRLGRGGATELVHEVLNKGVKQCFGGAEAIPTDHSLEFFRDYVGAIIATEARSEARQLSTKPVTSTPRSAAHARYKAHPEKLELYCEQTVSRNTVGKNTVTRMQLRFTWPTVTHSATRLAHLVCTHAGRKK